MDSAEQASVILKILSKLLQCLCVICVRRFMGSLWACCLRLSLDVSSHFLSFQEQQQVLLYQLMQQQQQQQQQQNDVQLPINSMLPGTQSTITNNPFLAMHDSNASKTGVSSAQYINLSTL